MGLTIILGVPGAGKSTVLAVVPKGYQMVNYGTEMFRIARKNFGVSHRDDLRRLDTATQSKVQAAVGDELAKIAAPKAILDTHCSIKTGRGFLPGLPKKLLEKLHVDQLVLIAAPIDDIIQRRESDTSRVRDSESREDLQLHHDFNLGLLASYASISGAPAKIIWNRNGGLEAAQKELVALLE